MYGFKPRHAQGKPVQNLAGGGIVHSLTGMLGMRKRTPEELRAAAAKAGTQVYAQLVSSAYGMMHTSAGISGSATMSVGYSYGGDVSGTVSPVQSIG